MPLISWEKMTRFSWVLSFHSWALTRWNRKLLLFYLLHQEMDARAKLINVHEQCMYLNPVVFDPLAGKEPINHGKNLPLWYEFKGKFKRKKHGFAKQSHNGIHYSFQHYRHSWQKRNAPMSLKKSLSK